MGHHRAARRGEGEIVPCTSPHTYVGRRVAGRPTAPAAAEASQPATVESVPTVSPAAELILDDAARASRSPQPLTAQPLTAQPVVAGGRRKAQRRTPRTTAARILPPTPVIVGVATLAVAFGGAASSAEVAAPDQSAVASTSTYTTHAPTALSGSDGVGSVDLLGRSGATVSRDSSRQALAAARGPSSSPLPSSRRRSATPRWRRSRPRPSSRPRRSRATSGSSRWWATA